MDGLEREFPGVHHREESDLGLERGEVRNLCHTEGGNDEWAFPLSQELGARVVIIVRCVEKRD